MGPVAAINIDRTFCDGINYGHGLGNGFRQQSIAETHLFFFQLINKRITDGKYS